MMVSSGAGTSAKSLSFCPHENKHVEIKSNNICSRVEEKRMYIGNNLKGKYNQSDILSKSNCVNDCTNT